MFGHTWLSQYGARPDGIGGDTWAAALAGVTGAQLAAGLQATLALGSDYPPSAPRFRALCLGIPSLATVRVELARRDARRSPFVVLVWSHVDAHRYRMADADRADRMLREAYDAAREHVMRGGSMPEPAVELEAPAPTKRTPAPPEVAEWNLSEIATALRLADQAPETAPGSELRMEERA